jgi:DNA-binding HxlR family transcriptional regulator
MPESSSETQWSGGDFCSIERTLEIVGDRWTFLVLRQSIIYGMTRFSDFEHSLRIAPNILTDRLERVVGAGILEKRVYQEPGLRPRFSYHCTPMGQGMKVVLGALQQWGDDNIPPETGPSLLRRSVDGARSLHVSFVDDTGELVTVDDVIFLAPPDDN